MNACFSTISLSSIFFFWWKEFKKPFNKANKDNGDATFLVSILSRRLLVGQKENHGKSSKRLEGSHRSPKVEESFLQVHQQTLISSRPDRNFSKTVLIIMLSRKLLVG